MKKLFIILFLLTPLFMCAEDLKPESKKEVIYKKSHDIISTDFYIKKLRLKRSKTVKC